MCAAFFSDAKSKAAGVYKLHPGLFLPSNRSMNECIAMQKDEFRFINLWWFDVVFLRGQLV